MTLLAGRRSPRSAKLSKNEITQLCKGQYRVQQEGSVPAALFCRLQDIENYGDGVINTAKNCATSYKADGSYPHQRNFVGAWSRGFSTW